MIRNLTVPGFHDTKLVGLSRVNVVVGDNGSGKTALLGAIASKRRIASAGTRLLSRDSGGFEVAGAFSAVERAGNARVFADEMKGLFPAVESVALQNTENGPRLCARLSGEKTYRPLRRHSQGMEWLALILLSISASPLVLIDEIETSVHHSRFLPMWQSVRFFASRFRSQVFATTHSLECLNAAAEWISYHPRDFTLIRTTRLDANCVARILPGEDAGHLIRSRLEVRG